MRRAVLLVTVLGLLYWAVRRLLGLLVLIGREQRAKDVEMLMLGHELQVLRRQVAHPRLRGSDRALRAAFSSVLPRERRRSFLVQPATLLGWHRELVRRRWTYERRRLGAAAAAAGGARAGVTAGGGEPDLGVQAHPWRAGRARPLPVGEQRLQHPPSCRCRAGAAACQPQLARVLAPAGERDRRV